MTIARHLLSKVVDKRSMLKWYQHDQNGHMQQHFEVLEDVLELFCNVFH